LPPRGGGNREGSSSRIRRACRRSLACPSRRARPLRRYNALPPIQRRSRVSPEPDRDPTWAHSQASPIRRIRFSRAPLQPDSIGRVRGWRCQNVAEAASEVGACAAIENKEFSEASPEARREAFTEEQQCAAKRPTCTRARATTTQLLINRKILRGRDAATGRRIRGRYASRAGSGQILRGEIHGQLRRTHERGGARASIPIHDGCLHETRSSNADGERSHRSRRGAGRIESGDGGRSVSNGIDYKRERVGRAARRRVCDGNLNRRIRSCDIRRANRHFDLTRSLVELAGTRSAVQKSDRIGFESRSADKQREIGATRGDAVGRN